MPSLENRMNRILLTLTLTFITTAGADLHGSIIVGADGTFLGLCDGPTGPASLANPASPYGNPFSRTSIYNRAGPYGSLYSIDSAYKLALSRPPYLIQTDAAFRKALINSGYRISPEMLHMLEIAPVNRITANRLVKRAIHPDELRRECAAS